MIVRALDVNHDWTFGKGKNNYLRNQRAVSQNIDTRLLSFLGNCFFKVDAGIDWFNLLGAKSEISINLAVSTTILSTLYVTGIIQKNIIFNVRLRSLFISYSVDTSFGAVSGSLNIPVNQIT